MVNLDLPKIKSEGEKQVKSWLTDNGYTDISQETLQSNEHGLIANGRVENILVQIKTFVHPHKPYKLSEFETDLITRRATKLKLVAYAAYVTLDVTGKILGEINWERLS